MDRWQNKIAVVTGASAGIGAAIAKDLVAAGLVVVGLARRVERVAAIRDSLPSEQQSRLHPKKCDISDEAAVQETFDWIESTLGGIDILVNNAGIYQPGQLCTSEMAIIRDTLNTNVMGVVYCTQRAFKSMKERSFDGHVIIINSIAGHYIPNLGTDQSYFNIYPSSKHAVTAMTEVYRQEFSGLGTKIKITSISPGAVATEILGDALKNMPERKEILNAEDVSGAVLYAISTPPHVQVHEIIIKPVGEKF